MRRFGDALEQAVEVGAGRGRHRDQQVQGTPAHRRDVADIHDDRPPPELGHIGPRRRVDARHDGIRRKQQGAGGRVHDGGVVADGREQLAQPRQQRELAGQNDPPVTSTHRA